MKKISACLLVVCLIFTGCTGSFKMTRSLYRFHRSQTQVVDELIFLGCVILPVYGLTTLVDAVVLNSIEFWTGHNPMASNTPAEKEIITNGKEKAVLSYNANGSVTVTPAATPDKAITLSRNADGVSARDASGKLLYYSQENPDGSVTVYNAQHQPYRTFSEATVAKERQEVLAN